MLVKLEGMGVEFSSASIAVASMHYFQTGDTQDRGYT